MISQRFLSFLLLSGGLLLLAFGRPPTDPASAFHTAPAATPTLDRLAKPTVPANPSQADLGAQDYWLYCSPCHGDKAQGLTDEFRLQYPPEDQYCWKSGCHGRRPYPNGWTIPTPVPALVGVGALMNFSDAAQVFAFMRAAMPFQTPGSLDDATYWRITAFLLRQNDYRQESAPLDENNASAVLLPRSFALAPTPTLFIATPAPAAQTPSPGDFIAGAGFLLVMAVIAGLIRAHTGKKL